MKNLCYFGMSGTTVIVQVQPFMLQITTEMEELKEQNSKQAQALQFRKQIT